MQIQKLGQDRKTLHLNITVICQSVYEMAQLKGCLQVASESIQCVPYQLTICFRGVQCIPDVLPSSYLVVLDAYAILNSVTTRQTRSTAS